MPGMQLDTASPHDRVRAFRPAHAAPPSTAQGSFRLLGKDYSIRFADHCELLRTRTSELVERLYAHRGLYASHAHATAQTGQTTLAACDSGGEVFGTLTLGLDGATGLLAESLYGPQIDAVRRAGGRVCEVTRLAMDPARSSNEAIARLFHLTFILARLVHGMTDLFIEVHPRHSAFYRRMLGYREAGPECICPRVGAPAVLLHLPLHDAEQRIRARGSDRSLYRLFMSEDEQRALAERLLCPTALLS
ncbi:long-chain N-acyl amino acid synthase [Pseudothauera lacus]|uniref:Long-chain N-acyl amino acid synthase n=2 Tax=Pseudothauera lacus TaxID=2136175 RepID=A0A2T4IG61_9RHOO|nr:long-chain N-acyl amino acid synthase [Pseudothauera lacus]